MTGTVTPRCSRYSTKPWRHNNRRRLQRSDVTFHGTRLRASRAGPAVCGLRGFMTRPLSLWITLEWIRRSAVVTSSGPPCPHLPGARPWAFGFGSGALDFPAATVSLPSVPLQGSTSTEPILLCRAPANRHCRRYARCQLRTSTSGGTHATRQQTTATYECRPEPAKGCKSIGNKSECDANRRCQWMSESERAKAYCRVIDCRG